MIRKSDEKRNRILESALHLFEQRGFFGTSVNDIAKEALVAPGTIYIYFENKEALVNHLYQHWKQVLLEKLQEDQKRGSSPQELFDQYCTTFLRFGVAHPVAYRFMELHHHGPYLTEESLEVSQRVVDFGLRFLKKHKERMNLKTLPNETLLSICFGVLLGFLKFYWDMAITDKNLERQMKQVVGCARDAIFDFEHGSKR